MQVIDGADAPPPTTNPNDADAPAPSAPFQLTLRTVATEPSVVNVPFQIWLIDCPLANAMVTFHEETALLPAATTTCPCTPVPQVFVAWKVAVQPPDAAGAAGWLADSAGTDEAGTVAGAEVSAGTVIAAAAGGSATPVARLAARLAWNEPAEYVQPSASPGGLIHRYPSIFASPVFSVG